MEPLSRIQLLAAMGVTAVVWLLVSRLWLWIDDIALMPLQLDGQHTLIGIGLGLGITLASAITYEV